MSLDFGEHLFPFVRSRVRTFDKNAHGCSLAISGSDRVLANYAAPGDRNKRPAQ